MSLKVVVVVVVIVVVVLLVIYSKSSDLTEGAFCVLVNTREFRVNVDNCWN